MSAAKHEMFEEMARNQKKEDLLHEIMERDDEVGFKETDFINLELIKAVEDIQNKTKKGDQ